MPLATSPTRRTVASGMIPITDLQIQLTKGILQSYEKNNISNGPGKLTMALNIDRRLDKEDLTGDRLYIETDGLENFKIIKTTRIGIDYAEEAVDYPYRFYIKDNPYVSKL